MRHDTIASFLQKKFLAKIVTYGSLASRWRIVCWLLPMLCMWYRLHATFLCLTNLLSRCMYTTELEFMESLYILPTNLWLWPCCSQHLDFVC